MQFEADYFDGISPRAKRVLVTVRDGHALIIAPVQSAETAINTLEATLQYEIKHCTVQARLGQGRRLIDLPDDTRLETDYPVSYTHLDVYKRQLLPCEPLFIRLTGHRKRLLPK